MYTIWIHVYVCIHIYYLYHVCRYVTCCICHAYTTAAVAIGQSKQKKCVGRLINKWVTLHIWMGHIPDMNESCHKSERTVAWRLRIHIFVWLDLFMSVTWLIHVCDMTHSCVRHDWFICVTWHICDLFMNEQVPWPPNNRDICRETFKWVMSYIRMSTVTYMKDSRHTH